MISHAKISPNALQTFSGLGRELGDLTYQNGRYDGLAKANPLFLAVMSVI